MRGPQKEALPSSPSRGVFNSPWQRKLWWLLPLGVLFLLIGIIYVLGHMSSADSEMYPTTLLQHSTLSRSC